MLVFDAIIAVQGGGYVNPLKAIPPFLILVVWARLLTWADKDAEAAHMPRIPLNISNLGGLVFGFALFFLLPTFAVAFMATTVVFLAECGVYLLLRHQKVGLGDLQREFKAFLKGTKGEKDEFKVVAGRITLVGKEGKPLPVPEDSSPDFAAYDIVQQALTDPILKGAQQVDVAPEGEQMGVRFTVDNVAHKGPMIDRAGGAAAIAYMKWAAGLNVEDRRRPQEGNVKILLDKAKHELRVRTAGTTAGEYLRMIVDPKTRHFFKLAELGFSDAQKQVLEDLIKTDKGGLVLLSAPKGHGLTSLLYTILRSHDAFLEHVHTIEHDQEQDLEGITQNKVAANATTEEEFKQVDWVISQEPDILGVSRVQGPKSAAALIASAKAGKRVYVCMRANSAFEALEQWKRLVGDSAKATEAMKLVINGRVLRKLCMACKEGFAPDPATLKRLNLAADKVSTLYKARESGLRDARGNAMPCEFCHDLRYKGRSGVFEFMLVDAEIRQALDAGKSLNQAFRKQRGKYLQEEALVLVEQGDTSVQEVLRVLKPAAEGDKKSDAASAPAGGRGSAAAGPAVRNRK